MLNDETSTPQTAPAKKPAPPQQPEAYGAKGTVIGEAQRAARDISINEYLKAALEAHRASGQPWGNAEHTSPLDREGKVKSPFSKVRIHPTKKIPLGHPALDIVPLDGGPANVVGMLPGTVIYKGWFSPDSGNAIMVLNDNGELDFYAHLATGTFAHIHPGERIRQGQILAEMGETGEATGPHVHITVRPLSTANKQMSALAQAQQMPDYVAPVIIDGTTGLPMPIKPLEDPALKWTSYENVNPSIAGKQYMDEQRVEAPSRQVLMAGNPPPDWRPTSQVAAEVQPQQPIPVAQTDEIPTESGLPANMGKDANKGTSVPPFKR